MKKKSVFHVCTETRRGTGSLTVSPRGTSTANDSETLLLIGFERRAYDLLVLPTSNPALMKGWKYMPVFTTPHNVSCWKLYLVCAVRGGRDSAVGIATGYGLDDRRVGLRVPVGAKMFSSPRRPDCSGSHPASYPMGTGGKMAEGWSSHSPVHNGKDKNTYNYTFTPPYVFMAWCSIDHGCKFTLPVPYY
jgi:hypothetical protein